MKRQESGQLLLAFADSPKGSKEAGTTDVSAGRAHLQQIAKTRKAKETCTPEEAIGLLEEIASLPNLASALLQVSRNGGAPGVDGLTVKDILRAAPRLLLQFRADLLSGRYQPGEVRRVEIRKPGGGTRNLGIPNVADRWVQQAVHQILSPLYEPKFHPSSHGFRLNRGAATAIEEAKAHLAGGATWVVSIDLSKFFDRVNHQRLLAKLSQTVPDPRVLRLVHQMLKAKVVLANGTRVNVEEGTPQGGPLSPLLSNIVLDELDWEMHRRGLKFVRYADDFNIYVGSKRSGERVLASLTAFIERRLRLKVNGDKSEVSTPCTVHFLGFCLSKRKDGEIGVWLSKRTTKRIAVRVRELTPRTWGQSLQACFDRANIYLRGWIGYFRLCTKSCLGSLRTIDAHIRRRIRAIIVKQKKTRRALFNHFCELGLSLRVASSAWAQSGPWKKSYSSGMNIGYRTQWFAGRLVNLERSWIRLNAPPPPVVKTQLEFGF